MERLNETQYLDGISAKRAMLLAPEEALRGEATISLETQGDPKDAKFSNFVQTNFPTFMRLVHRLPKDDQELLLSYFLLSKTQTVLAKQIRCSQTQTSARIREAIQSLGALVMLGDLEPQTVAPLFKWFGVESAICEKYPLSQALSEYLLFRSFTYLAAEHQIKPTAQIRRGFRVASDRLLANSDTVAIALGGYLNRLLRGTSARGQGLTGREQAKFAPYHSKDPAILGEFRIDVTHPDAGKLFQPLCNDLKSNPGQSD